MKKAVICILLVAALLLAGCSSPSSASQNSAAGGDEASGETAAPDFSFSGTLKMLTQSNYQRTLTGNEAGYYSYSSLKPDSTFNILYTDYATKKQIYLCNRVECTHSDESCTSWVQYKAGGGAVPLLLEDRLALMHLGSKFMYEQYGEDALAHLDTLGLNGAGRKTVLRMKPNTSLVNDYATDGKRLYSIQETAVQQGDTGDVLLQREVVAIDLDTGELTVLHKLPDNGDDDLCAAYEDRLVFSTWYFAPGSPVATERTFYEISLNSPGETREIARCDTSAQYAETFGGQLYTLDLQTSALTCRGLSTGKERVVLPSLMAVRSEAALFFKEPSSLCYVIDYWDGKIVLYMSYIDQNTSEDTTHWYAVDTASGSVNELTLQFRSGDMMRHMDILAETETHFLVCMEEAIRTIQVQMPDGSVGSAPDPYKQLALIKKADYWNSVPNFEPIEMIA